VTVKYPMRTTAGKALASLLVLAALALTLHSLVFSDASFVASSSNPGNVFTAGSLSHTNSVADQVVFDAAFLRPGLSKEGTVTIEGSGGLTGVYTLTKGAVVDSSADGALSQTLVLTVEEVGATTPIFDDTIAAWQDPLLLGSIAPGPSSARTYLLRLAYPAGSADSALDGTTLTLPMTFTGTSP
jgi:spore coat-associated protein N